MTIQIDVFSQGYQNPIYIYICMKKKQIVLSDLVVTRPKFVNNNAQKQIFLNHTSYKN